MQEHGIHYYLYLLDDLSYATSEINLLMDEAEFQGVCGEKKELTECVGAEGWVELSLVIAGRP
jgi:hypothetical protein